MAAKTSVVLPRRCRFSDVSSLVSRLGFEGAHVTPQVFPGRPEPAQVRWVDAEQVEHVRFNYRVNPDRRVLRCFGDEAASIAEIVRRRLGEDSREALFALLLGEDSGDAAYAVAALADIDAPGLIDAVSQRCARRSGDPDADEFVVRACVLAVERSSHRAVEQFLVDVTYDRDMPAAARAEAQAALENWRSRNPLTP